MSLLTELVDSTQARVAQSKATVPVGALEQRIATAARPRGFRQALMDDDVAIIAEIKRASPAKGPLALDLDASDLARRFVEGGAAAISVLTEPDRFRGSNEDLQVAATAGVPVLRKDFILDEWQVMESRAIGADAILLIVRALGDELATLVSATRALGMDALVEVHTEADVARAVDAGAELVGINHRDLGSFEVDPHRTAELVGSLPAGTTVVALSGVSTRTEVEELSDAGADAVLVGEALVTAADPVATLLVLRGK